jgi:hypothetical protein
MSFGSWLLGAFVFIVILFIVLGIGFWARNHRPKSTPNKAFTNALGWGPPVQGPDPNKNICLLYQFPTTTITVDQKETVYPGNPTYNTDILNDLQGSSTIPLCIDTDQALIQQLQHSCTGYNASDPGISLCYLLTGGTTGLDGSEVYYGNCLGRGSPRCPGQISLVSINYQSPFQTNIYCLNASGPDQNVTMNPCNPSIPQQLFRVTRINPGQNPNSLRSGQGQQGIIAQIYDRNSGLCLMKGNSLSSTIYDPAYLKNTQCVGPQKTITASNVVLGDCQGGQTGYSWLFLQSVQYCDSNLGCPPGNLTTTPPQIVYIGDADMTTFPGSTGYNGFTGPSAIIQWLLEKGGGPNTSAQSLYFGGAGNGLILQDLGTDVSDCEQKPFNAQYINLSLYNTITEQAVCYSNNSFSPCLNL